MKKLGISSIRPVGKRQVYNLRMRNEPHNFVLGSGVVSANSHATAYSVITYWTAILKARWPIHFYSALLACEGKPENIIRYACAIKEAGITILPPDVNLSGVFHQPEGKAIRFGLGHIKGMPQADAEKIVQIRDAR